jgi:hypothetical protein
MSFYFACYLTTLSAMSNGRMEDGAGKDLAGNGRGPIEVVFRNWR